MADIFSIFDPAPSSLNLLRERPLGMNYKEPTLKELMQPLPPPDRVLFKHGAMFNRFVHSEDRKRNFTSSEGGGTPANSARGENETPSKQHQQEQEQQQQQQQPKEDKSDVAVSEGDATMKPVAEGDELSQASASPTVSFSDSPQQQESPSQRQSSADNGSLQAQKSMTLLARGFKSNQQRRNQRDRTNSDAVVANPLAGVRQEYVPSARLPNRGMLPSDPKLLLVELRGEALDTKRDMDDFIVHGRDVITHKHDGTALQPGTVSPLRAYSDLVKRSSPGRRRKKREKEEQVEAEEQLQKQQQQQQQTGNGSGSSGRNSTSRIAPSPPRGSRGRRPSPLRRLFSAGKHKSAADEMTPARGQFHEMDHTAEEELHRRDEGATKNNHHDNDDDDEEGEDEDDFDEASDMEQAAKMMALLRDPQLAPGIVFARSQLPPWKDEPKPDAGAAALALAAGLKKRKKSGKKGLGHFAAQTAANKQHVRRQSIAKPQQQQQSNQQQQPGGGAASEEEDRVELMRKQLDFSKQLRVEDKEELAVAKKAIAEQRKRHLDEMILARLAPAERQERIASAAMLQPFRRVGDRNLPFPETAARDRYSQAQRSKEIPELVMDGLEQVSKWRPHPKSNTISVDQGHQFAPSNESILVQKMGLSATPASPMRTRAGAGSHSTKLRAVAALPPKEGQPKMCQPTSPVVSARQTQAQDRFAAQENAHATKMQNLQASLEARQNRAEMKKTKFL